MVNTVSRLANTAQNMPSGKPVKERATALFPHLLLGSRKYLVSYRRSTAADLILTR